MGGSTTTNNTTNTTTEQKSAPDEQAMAAYRSWLPVFQSTAQTPWNPATAQQIAGFTPQQLAAYEGIGNMQGMYVPYYDWAAENTAGGAAGSARLMDPYMQQAAAYNAQGAQGTAGTLAPYYDAAQRYMQGSAAATAQALDPWLQAGSQNYAGQLDPWLSQGAANTAQELAPWLSQGTQNYAGKLDPWLSQGTANTAAALDSWLKNASGNIDIGAREQAGALTPWLNQASGLTGQAAAPISSTAIKNYLSPYQSDVIDATMAQINAANQQQQTQLVGNATVAGALGGNRIGVAQGTLGGQQALNTATTLAGLNQQNYTQALAAAQQDAARRLQAGSQFAQYGSIAQTAQQADAARRLQAAQQYAGLGAEQQQALQNYAARQLQGGQMQQAALSDYAARQLQGGQMQQQALQNYAARQLQAGQMQQAALDSYANRNLQAGTAQQQAMQGDLLRQYQAGAGIAGLGTNVQQAQAQDYARAMQAGQNIYGYGAGYAQQTAQDYARQLAAAQQMGALGTGAQANALQGYQAEIQAGTMQQQQAQNMLNAAQQNAVAQTMWDYQNQQWLAAMLGQSVPLMGGTVSGTSSGTSTSKQQENPGVGSYIGMGLGLMSMMSDERAKENIEPIGKSFDGQPIYKYNYKGQPTTQIGMIAQDVEKRHPEAVQEDSGGTKYVNYDLATNDAANRGHFARGGGAFSSYDSYFPWAEFNSEKNPYPSLHLPSLDLRPSQALSPSSSHSSSDPMSSYKSMKDQAVLGKGLGQSLGQAFQEDNGWGASYETTGGSFDNNLSASMSNLGDALSGMFSFGFADGGSTPEHAPTPKLSGSQYVTPGAHISSDDYYKAANEALAASSVRHPTEAPAPIPWGADPNNPANQAGANPLGSGNPIANLAGGMIGMMGGTSLTNEYLPSGGRGADSLERQYDPSIVNSLPLSYREKALAQMRASEQIKAPTSRPGQLAIPAYATSNKNDPYGIGYSGPPPDSWAGKQGHTGPYEYTETYNPSEDSEKLNPFLPNPVLPWAPFSSHHGGITSFTTVYEPGSNSRQSPQMRREFADGGDIGGEFGFPETWEKYKPYEPEMVPGGWHEAVESVPGRGEVPVGYPTDWLGRPRMEPIPSPMEGRSLSDLEAFGGPSGAAGEMLPGVATKSPPPTFQPGAPRPTTERGLGVLERPSTAALMSLTAGQGEERKAAVPDRSTAVVNPTQPGAYTYNADKGDWTSIGEDTPKTSPHSGVVGTIVDEFRSAGATDAAIRGILANVKDESGFNPALRHPDQPKWGGEAHYAHGLYQEGGSEWNKYAGWLKENHPDADWRDPRLQTKFLAQNLQENYPKVWAKMNSGTPEEAAQAFISGYLRPSVTNLANRHEKYGRGVPEIEHYLGEGESVSQGAAPKSEGKRGLGVLEEAPSAQEPRSAAQASQLPQAYQTPQRERSAGLLRGLGIDFNPLGLSDEQRERLLYLGMGMAGNARNPMAGGMEGLKAYAGMQIEDRRAQFEGMRMAMEAQKMARDFAMPQVIGETPGPYGTTQKIFGKYSQEARDFVPTTPTAGAVSGAEKNNAMFPGYNLIGSRVHGDELLKQLPPEQASRIRGLANYDRAPPTGKQAESPQGQHEIALAQQYNPAYEPSNFAPIQKVKNDFLTGKSKDSLQAANTLIKNLAEFVPVVEKLGNTSYPAYNSIRNWARAQGGDPRADDFVAVNNKVSEEAVRLFRGVGGAEADVKRELENLNAAKSPEQMKTIINRLIAMAEDRVSSLAQQRDEAFPVDGAKRFPILTQDTIEKVDMVKRWASGAKPEGKAMSEPVTVRTEEDYRALKPGTWFKDPAGSVRIKP